MHSIMADMSGAIIPIIYASYQGALFWNIRRWMKRAEMMTYDNADALLQLTRLRRPKDDVIVSILKFSDRRKRAIRAYTLALVLFFFALSMYAATLTLDQPKLLSEIGSALFLCVLGSAPWILVVEPYGNVRVLTKKGIIKRSPWTGTAFVSWDEMTSVRWVPLIDNFFIRSAKGSFSVNPVYENLDRFAEAVQMNLPRSKWAHASEKLSLATRGPFQP